MIEIPEHLLAEVVAHALREAPDEVCGWLAGRGGRVERTYPVTNGADDRRVAFVMEPEAQLRAMREVREAGLELAGTYHSHPRTPPCPSSRDRGLARYPDLAHVIVSLAAAEPEACCYRILEDGEERARPIVVTRVPLRVPSQVPPTPRK